MTTEKVGKSDQGRSGVEIKVFRDGRFELFGETLRKDELPNALKKAHTEKGRAIILEAQTSVPIDDLVEIRKYLVHNNFPNVTIVSARSVSSYESE